MDWPIPIDLRSLRGFLGLTGYYRRFVENYRKIAWSLTQLLKKDSFKWGEGAQMGFEKLKKAMTSLPVLAVPSFTEPFVMETDASGKGIGAVLMQDGRLIACMSQVLFDRAQNKSIYERELMAIVLVVQKWWHYLLGQHFVLHTNQRSLKYLLDQRVMGEDQQKWVTKLLGYNFEIKYEVGNKNRAAESLSRKLQYFAISMLMLLIGLI